MAEQTEREKQIAILKQQEAMIAQTMEQAKQMKNVSQQGEAAKLQEFAGQIQEQYGTVGETPQEQPTMYQGSYLKSEVGQDGKIRRDAPKEDDTQIDFPEIKVQRSFDTNIDYRAFSTYNPRQKFDVIPLPSNGQTYPHKKGKLPVAYLTALDENILISPNAYRDGIVVDTLLHNKIMDRSVDPDDLIQADRDAIVMWLRMTGYDPLFSVIVPNPFDNGNTFQTKVDLTKIKSKELKLKGDENGWFDFTLPLSGDIVKFSYTTRRQDRNYLALLNKTSQMVQQKTMEHVVSDIEDMVANELVNFTPQQIEQLRETTEIIETEAKKMGFGDVSFFNKNMTEKMQMFVKQVKLKPTKKEPNTEWITERNFLLEYVENMRTMDAQKLREYIEENEPSLDMNIEITVPEGVKGENGDLGGGSKFKTFLSIESETIFIQ